MKINFNIWRIIGLLAIILFAFFFFKVVVYLVIAGFLFLLGNPITHRIEKLHIGKWRVPNALAAIVTILLIVGIVFSLFFLIIPPLMSEIGFISELNFYDVMHNILEQYPSAKSLLHKFGNETDLEQSISAQLNQHMNADNISSVLNHTLSYFGSALGGTLCVLFITFFLLKDENMMRESLLVVTPTGTEDAMKEIMLTSKKMLSKYFGALLLDMFIVGLSALLVLTLLGVENALIIAFCAGVLNMIPYIGSVITMIIAVVLGASSCISASSYELIGPTINKIFFALLSINLIDAFVVQPLLFSKSVKAHPLEIFIVTLMAGTIGGIIGMVVALPTYTLIRIVAKEFLTHLKFFKKISDTLD
ncbi:MAG: AI-2E family transporter [Bacteroidia bacterium]|nr:AI-2E family transporter [Bacteroidia bacterium]